MAFSTRTRRAVSTVLALVLAVETVSAVAAAVVTRPVTHQLPAEPPAGTVLAAEAAVVPVVPGPVVTVTLRVPSISEEPDRERTHPVPAAVAAEQVRPKAPTRVKAPKRDESRGTKSSSRTQTTKTSSQKSSRESSAPRTYKGTNYVWIPSLGINRSVRWFPCDRQRPPDNYMYRWGCAGTNNVYLMGHAYSVMEPLHDAYVSGRLRKGMKAWYADAKGKVRVYAVRWWKVTLPTTDAAWAWAAQDVPSMTLQTCVGKNSKYRLMVRLVEVNG